MAFSFQLQSWAVIELEATPKRVTGTLESSESSGLCDLSFRALVPFLAGEYSAFIACRIK